MELVGIVVVARESQVVFRVKPDLKARFPVSHAHPLSDVELLLLYDKGGFNILLRHPDFVQTAADVVYQVVFC